MTAINNKAKLFSLCMVLFIDAIGSGLILPILPELFFNPEYGLLQGYAFHNTNVIYGITLAVFPLASLFGKYLFGALSDHVGRKKTIIAGLSIILLSYLLSIIAIMIDSIPLFILARFITGFGAGTYTAVYAMIADMSKTIERKMTNFKWPALATVLGFIVGPILGGASGIAHGQLSLVIPFAIGFILTLLNIFKAKASLEENVVVQGSHHFSPLFFFKESYHYLLSIKNKKLIKYLLGSYLVFQFAIGLYIQSISLYLSEYCHFTTNQIGFFYVVMGGRFC
ncbi:MFS transporter [Shewanella psychropiezotolerans]|uniref:MFS transporter n=1 Tax=Shewanella psychropiezotolerans TaxID=2593655 RepID=UPI001C8F638C|nr:MFS transporter [Shewanella psychropiezotolerans]